MTDTTDPRFVDFDAEWATGDAPAAPIRFRMFGEVYELPADMPAAVVVRVARWVAEKRSIEDLTTADLLGVATDFVPPEVLESWRRHGITGNQLADAIGRLFAIYVPQD